MESREREPLLQLIHFRDGKMEASSERLPKSPAHLRPGTGIGWQEAQSHAHPAAGQDPSSVTFPPKSHL